MWWPASLACQVAAPRLAPGVSWRQEVGTGVYRLRARCSTRHPDDEWAFGYYSAGASRFRVLSVGLVCLHRAPVGERREARTRSHPGVTAVGALHAGQRRRGVGDWRWHFDCPSLRDLVWWVICGECGRSFSPSPLLRRSRRSAVPLSGTGSHTRGHHGLFHWVGWPQPGRAVSASLIAAARHAG